jgi:hypothetical protein
VLDRISELKLSAIRYDVALVFVRQCLGFSAKKAGISVAEFCQVESSARIHALKLYENLIMGSFDFFPKRVRPI